MATLQLKPNKLYILSGISGSGKKHLLFHSNIPNHAIISKDRLRHLIGGNEHRVIEGEHYNLPSTFFDDQIHTFILNLVEIRAKEHLTTFLNVPNLNDGERQEYVTIAEQYGMDVEVIIMSTDLAQALAYNQKRTNILHESHIHEEWSRFNPNSDLKTHTVDSNDRLLVSYPCLNNNKVDVIGSTHGLLNSTVDLFKSLGYQQDDAGALNHPDERKILFLGGFINLDHNSVDMLKFVKAGVEAGYYLAIQGHPEYELLKLFSRPDFKRHLQNRPLINAFKALPEIERKTLLNFLKELPLAYQLKKNYVFCHADMNNAVDPYQPASRMIYGASNFGEKDIDHEYEVLFRKKINEQVMVRGSTPQTSQQEHSFSLSDASDATYTLHILPLDRFDIERIRYSNRDAFERSVQTAKCHLASHNRQCNTELLYELMEMEQHNLVIGQYSSAHELNIFNYTRNAFKQEQATLNQYLKKAKGIVLDKFGNIVQHPLDKIFTYSPQHHLTENTELCYAVEKLHGNIACITNHPHKADLLISVGGEFNDAHFTIVKQSINETQHQKLLNYLREHNRTLIIEVVKPPFDHYIKYGEIHQGLYLVGARENHLGAKPHTEEKLDAIANLLDLKRPNYNKKTFREIKANLFTDCGEGVIVRANNADQDILFKLYSLQFEIVRAYKLIPTEQDLLFSHPDFIKCNLPHRMHRIVDQIVALYSLNDWSVAKMHERIMFLKCTLTEMMEQEFKVMAPRVLNRCA